MIKKSTFDKYLDIIQIWGRCLKSAPFTKIKWADDIYHRLNQNNSYNRDEYGYGLINAFEPQKILELSNFLDNQIDVQHIISTHISINNYINAAFKSGDLILLTNQIDPIENGLYVYNNGLTKKIVDTKNLSVRRKISYREEEVWWLKQNAIKVYNTNAELDIENCTSTTPLNTNYIIDWKYPIEGEPQFFKSGGNYLLRNSFNYLLFDETYVFNRTYNYNNIIWTIGNFGTILKWELDSTIKASEPNYVKIPIKIKPDLLDIKFITDEIGFICGTDGALLRTSDKGNTWIVCDTNTTETIKSIDFLSVDFGVAVGSNGLLLTTADSGNTWIQTYFNLSDAQDFKSASLFNWDVNYKGLLIVGVNGTFLRLKLNTDLTWSAINLINQYDISQVSNSKVNYNVIKFISTDTWIIGGDNFLALYTFNTGLNSDKTESFTKFDIVNVNTVIKFNIVDLNLYWDASEMLWNIYAVSLADEINSTRILNWFFSGTSTTFQPYISPNVLNDVIYLKREFIITDTTSLTSLTIVDKQNNDIIFTTGSNKYLGLISGVSKSASKLLDISETVAIDEFLITPVRFYGNANWDYTTNGLQIDQSLPGKFNHNLISYISSDSSTNWYNFMGADFNNNIIYTGELDQWKTTSIAKYPEWNWKVIYDYNPGFYAKNEIVYYTNTYKLSLKENNNTAPTSNDWITININAGNIFKYNNIFYKSLIDNPTDFNDVSQWQPITYMTYTDMAVVGTWGGGLIAFEYSTTLKSIIAQNVTFTNAAYLNDMQFIYKLWNDSSNRLWISCTTGIYIIENDTIKKITSEPALAFGEIIDENVSFVDYKTYRPNEVMFNGTEVVIFKPALTDTTTSNINDINWKPLSQYKTSLIPSSVIFSTSSGLYKISNTNFLYDDYTIDLIGISTTFIDTQVNINSNIIKTTDIGLSTNGLSIYDADFVLKNVINKTTTGIVSNNIISVKWFNNTIYVITQTQGIFSTADLINWTNYTNKTKEIFEIDTYELPNNFCTDLAISTNGLLSIHMGGEISVKKPDDLWNPEVTYEYPFSNLIEGWSSIIDITQLETIFKPRLIFLDYFMGRKIQTNKSAKALLSINTNQWQALEWTPTSYQNETNTFWIITSGGIKYRKNYIVKSGTDYYKALTDVDVTVDPTTSIDWSPITLNDKLETNSGIIFNTWDMKWNANYLSNWTFESYPWAYKTGFEGLYNRRFRLVYTDIESNKLEINNWSLDAYTSTNGVSQATQLLPKTRAINSFGVIIPDESGNPVQWYKNRLLVCAYGQGNTSIAPNAIGTPSGKNIRMLLNDDITSGGGIKLYAEAGDAIWIQIDRDNRFDQTIYEPRDIMPDETTTLYSGINFINSLSYDASSVDWDGNTLVWGEAGWASVDLYWALPESIIRYINDYKLPIKVKIRNISRFGWTSNTEPRRIVKGFKEALDMHPVLNQIYTAQILQKLTPQNITPDEVIKEYIVIESKSKLYFNLASKLETSSDNQIQVEDWSAVKAFQITDRLESTENFYYEFGNTYGQDYNLYTFLNRLNPVFDKYYQFRNYHKNNIYVGSTASTSSVILKNLYNLSYDLPVANFTNSFTINERSIIFNISDTNGITIDQYNDLIVGTYFLVRKNQDTVLNWAGFIEAKSIVVNGANKLAKIDLIPVEVPWNTFPTDQKWNYIITDANDPGVKAPEWSASNSYNLNETVWKLDLNNQVKYFISNIINNTSDPNINSIDWTEICPTESQYSRNADLVITYDQYEYNGIYGEGWFDTSDTYDFIFDLTLSQISEFLNYTDDLLIRHQKLISDGYARVLSNDLNVRANASSMYSTNENNDVILTIFETWEQDPNMSYYPIEISKLNTGESYLIRYGEFGQMPIIDENYYLGNNKTFKKILRPTDNDFVIAWVDNSLVLWNESKNIFSTTPIESGVISDIELVEINSAHQFVMVACDTGLYQYHIRYEGDTVYTHDGAISIHNLQGWTNLYTDQFAPGSILNKSQRNGDDFWIAMSNGLLNLTTNTVILNTKNVLDFYIDTNNNIWIICAGELWFFDHITVTLILSSTINSIAQNQDTLWIASDTGLYHINLNVNLDLVLSSNQIVSHIAFVKNHIYTVLADQLQEFDPVTSLFTTNITIAGPLNFYGCNTTNTYIDYNTIPTVPTGINKLFVDSYGRIWLGCTNGLFLWNGYDFTTGTLFNTINTQLIGADVTGLTQGTNGMRQRVNGQELIYMNGWKLLTGLFEDVIEDICETTYGTLVIKTTNYNLNWDLTDLAIGLVGWSYVNADSNDLNGLFSDNVNSISVNKNTNVSLVPYHGDKPKSYPHNDKIANGLIEFVQYNWQRFTEGRIGIISLKDALVRSCNKVSFTKHLDVSQDKNKLLWIGCKSDTVQELWYIEMSNLFEMVQNINELSYGLGVSKLLFNTWAQNLDEDPLQYNTSLSAIGFDTPIISSNSTYNNNNKTRISRLNWSNVEGFVNNFTYQKTLSNNVDDINYGVTFGTFIGNNPSQKYEITNICAIETGDFIFNTVGQTYYVQNAARPTQFYTYDGTNYTAITYDSINQVDLSQAQLNREQVDIWSAGTYNWGDVVSYNGDLWQAISTTTAIPSTPDWTQVVTGMFGLTTPGGNSDILLNTATLLDSNVTIAPYANPIRDVRKNCILLGVSVKSSGKEHFYLMTFDLSSQLLPEVGIDYNNVEEKNILLGKYFWAETAPYKKNISGYDLITYDEVSDYLSSPTISKGQITDIVISPSIDSNEWNIIISTNGLNSGLTCIKTSLLNSINITQDKITKYTSVEDSLQSNQIQSMSLSLPSNTFNDWKSWKTYKNGDLVYYNNSVLEYTGTTNIILNDWTTYDLNRVLETYLATSWGIEKYNINEAWLGQVFEYANIVDLYYKPLDIKNILQLDSAIDSIVLGTKFFLGIRQAYNKWFINIDDLTSAYTLVNGLTFAKLIKDYNWIFNAYIENAYIGEGPGPDGVTKLIWFNGVWYCGLWLDGIWTNGLWINGTWMNGTWGTWETKKIGTTKYEVNWKTPQTNTFVNLSEWRNGRWINGLWENGIWNNGCWTTGIHNGGVWLNGTWANGIWNNGTFSGGDWCDGKFFNGAINESNARVVWHSGDFLGGDFEQGLWITGVFNELQTTSRFGTNSTKSNPAIWRTGLWIKGEMWGGINEILNPVTNTITLANRDNQWTVWHSGIWKYGKHYGGTWILGTWENGDWFDGLWVGSVNVAKINNVINIDIQNRWGQFGDVSLFNSLPADVNTNSESETARLLRLNFTEPIYIQPGNEFWISGVINTQWSELLMNRPIAWTSGTNEILDGIYNWKADKNYNALLYSESASTDLISNNYDLTGWTHSGVVEYFNNIWILKFSGSDPVVGAVPDNTLWSSSAIDLGYGAMPKKHTVDTEFNYDKYKTYEEMGQTKRKGLISPYVGSYSLVSDFNVYEKYQVQTSNGPVDKTFCSIGHLRRIYSDMTIMSEFKNGNWYGGVWLNGVMTGGRWMGGYWSNGVMLNGEIGNKK